MSRHIEVESETNTSVLGDVHAKWKVAGVEISVKIDNPAQDIRERVMIAAERFSDETRRILEGEPRRQQKGGVTMDKQEWKEVEARFVKALIAFVERAAKEGAYPHEVEALPGVAETLRRALD